MVISGCLNGTPEQILKFDVCNSNVISCQFADAQREEFQFKRVVVNVCHPEKDSGKIAIEIVMNGTVKNGSYLYFRKWVVADA